MNIAARFLGTWVRAMVVAMVLLGVMYGVAMAEEQGEEEFFVYLPSISNVEAPVFCGTQPLLLAPENGAALDTLNPTFRWTNANDADALSVRLEMATDAAFQNIFFRLLTPPSEGEREYLYLIGNLEPATVYYWRMYIACDGADGPYSETRSFTTGSGGTILPAPVATSPADNSTVSLPVTFSWQAVTGAVEYVFILNYPDGGWTTFGWDETSLALSYLDPGETYTWQVAARNDYAIGTFSEERAFTVANNVQGPLPIAEDAPAMHFWDGERLFELR